MIIDNSYDKEKLTINSGLKIGIKCSCGTIETRTIIAFTKRKTNLICKKCGKILVVGLNEFNKKEVA